MKYKHEQIFLNIPEYYETHIDALHATIYAKGRRRYNKGNICMFVLCGENIFFNLKNVVKAHDM